MEKEENRFYFLAAKESLLSGVKNLFLWQGSNFFDEVICNITVQQQQLFQKCFLIASSNRLRLSPSIQPLINQAAYPKEL